MFWIESTQTEHGESVDGRVVEDDAQSLHIGGVGGEACTSTVGGRAVPRGEAVEQICYERDEGDR